MAIFDTHGELLRVKKVLTFENDHLSQNIQRHRLSFVDVRKFFAVRIAKRRSVSGMEIIETG